MISSLRIIVLAALSPTLCQVSVPYVHRHDHLSAAELTAHLGECHRNCPGHDLPLGWHVHFLRLEAVGEAKSVPVVVAATIGEPDWKPALLRMGSTWTTAATVLDLGDNPLAAAATCERLASARSSRELLTHFCVLLI